MEYPTSLIELIVSYLLTPDSNELIFTRTFVRAALLDIRYEGAADRQILTEVYAHLQKVQFLMDRMSLNLKDMSDTLGQRY